VQLRLVFRGVPPSKNSKHAVFDSFLAYVERFDVLLNANSVSLRNADPSTQMPLLQRSLRSNGTRMGDVILVSSLRSPVDLVPSFNKAADNRLTKETALEYSPVFAFNDHFTKNLFYALSNE
jgi:hypothetical protein